jgi:hypothetical protein
VSSLPPKKMFRSAAVWMEDLELIARVCWPEEFANEVCYLPF